MSGRCQVRDKQSRGRRVFRELGEGQSFFRTRPAGCPSSPTSPTTPGVLLWVTPAPGAPAADPWDLAGAPQHISHPSQHQITCSRDPLPKPLGASLPAQQAEEITGLPDFSFSQSPFILRGDLLCPSDLSLPSPGQGELLSVINGSAACPPRPLIENSPFQGT